MKVISKWSLRPGSFQEAISRFLAGEAAPPPGVTLLGRWHAVDLSCGFSLYETDEPAALYRGTAKWADVLAIEHHVVIEDGDAAPVLAALKK